MEGVLTNLLYEESQVTVDHFLEDDIIEHPISFDFLVSQNVNSKSDQVKFLEDVISEKNYS